MATEISIGLLHLNFRIYSLGLFMEMCTQDYHNKSVIRVVLGLNCAALEILESFSLI